MRAVRQLREKRDRLITLRTSIIAHDIELVAVYRPAGTPSGPLKLNGGFAGRTTLRQDSDSGATKGAATR